ncbi:MAG: TrmH family RNA methyltransferase [Saprospirales bacterium]|nr:MAG: TrmH family RNA methyltransferase [Saprospirales bacterium]
MKKLSLEELNRPSIEEYKVSPKIPVVLILDNIRSGLNVGSIFRTADAFKIEKIYLVGITLVPPHREILKTAIGADQSVSWEYHDCIVSVVNKLKNETYEVVGIEQTDRSVMLHDFQVDNEKKYALVFGNEVGGISNEALVELDAVIEVPQHGTKHSLNVSVCAGLLIWHFYCGFASKS